MVVARSGYVVSLLELLYEWAKLVITDHAIMVTARRVLDREKPLEDRVAHYILEVPPRAKIERILSWSSAEHSEGVRSMRVSRHNGKSIVASTLLLTGRQWKRVGDGRDSRDRGAV